MKRRIVDGVEVHHSSGNVFADLGLPDADKLKIKSGLVIEIRKAMRRLGLTQQEAARRMGMSTSTCSDGSTFSNDIKWQSLPFKGESNDPQYIFTHRVGNSGS